jgi:hypothetical protein
MWFYASLLSKFIGRIPLESVAGMKWNQWPESRGIHGRNALEYAIIFYSAGLNKYGDD